MTAAATTCPTAAAPVAVTDYAYDDLDRLIRVTEALPAAQGGNRVTETVYNADDSVHQVKRAVGTALAQTYATTTYSANGLPVTLAYDNLKRLAGRSHPSSADNVAFAYDLLGWRTQAKYAENSHTVAYVRDAASSRSFAKHAAAFLMISNSISSRATGTVPPALQ